MMRYVRLNEQMASTIAAGLDADMMHGNVNAWTYLRRRHVPPEVALRILSQSGARRSTDAAPTIHITEESRALQQPAPSCAVIATPRRNQKLAQVIDQAILLSASQGSHYAQAFLKLQPLSNALILRVLFDADHRRPCPAPDLSAPVATA